MGIMIQIREFVLSAFKIVRDAKVQQNVFNAIF